MLFLFTFRVIQNSPPPPTLYKRPRIPGAFLNDEPAIVLDPTYFFEPIYSFENIYDGFSQPFLSLTGFGVLHEILACPPQQLDYLLSDDTFIQRLSMLTPFELDIINNLIKYSSAPPTGSYPGDDSDDDGDDDDDIPDIASAREMDIFDPEFDEILSEYESEGYDDDDSEK